MQKTVTYILALLLLFTAIQISFTRAKQAVPSILETESPIPQLDEDPTITDTDHHPQFVKNNEFIIGQTTTFRNAISDLNFCALKFVIPSSFLDEPKRPPQLKVIS